MKTLVRHTAVLAVTTAVVLLSAHAGYCGMINPQPLPPCHPNPMAQILHFVLSLLHVTG